MDSIVGHISVDNDISGDCNFENCRDDTSATPDTYAPCVPSTTQQPPMTVVPTAPPPPPPPPPPPLPRYPSRDRDDVDGINELKLHLQPPAAILITTSTVEMDGGLTIE
ncbi:hypothetical protein P8452_67294 [Trifolium repens]|nr:hypothetical protein P8452_67294 [Trifolium repens]